MHNNDYFLALIALGLWLLTALAAPAAAAAEPARGRNFDHHQTGFPLTGMHTVAPCESCHRNGVFKGTPTQCALCHTRGSGRANTAKPAMHFPTNAACDQCHDTRRFAGARYDHSGITPGGCTQCHNGAMAKGKPGNHVRTNSACDACHSTRAWRPATFDHGMVTPGTCGTCHQKPANHVITTAPCDSCHRTSAWRPARFDHSTVTPGTCGSCHNGSTATGKPANHVMTTASCDTCHRTSAWLPATFSHATVVPGSCATCHNGSNATGKPASHFVTSRACDACHTTTRWTPATSYSHTSALFPGQHNSSVTCRQCHTGNSETVAWPYATYRPDCAGCHANRYKPDPHKKSDGTRYTVLELRNCAGSCHIEGQLRSGQHRPSAAQF